jgi:hypothetical protein
MMRLWRNILIAFLFAGIFSPAWCSGFGSITNLTAGTAILTKAARQVFFYVQNNDPASPLLVTFKDGSGTILAQVELERSPSTGGGGGYVDSINFPLFFDATSVVLTSSTSTAQISSGASTKVPSFIPNS